MTKWLLLLSASWENSLRPVHTVSISYSETARYQEVITLISKHKFVFQSFNVIYSETSN
jgi:hypothetical protein